MEPSRTSPIRPCDALMSFHDRDLAQVDICRTCEPQEEDRVGGDEPDACDMDPWHMGDREVGDGRPEHRPAEPTKPRLDRSP